MTTPEIKVCPLPIKGVVIVALPDVDEALKWCRVRCSGRWSYETSIFPALKLASHDIPLYCFYFTNKADEALFVKTHASFLKLAREVLEV